MASQATYLFKHVLIQEAAYQSLLKSTRQQYHQRIAQVLAERLPDRSDLLAHHAWCGAQWDTAARAFQEAGSQALARRHTLRQSPVLIRLLPPSDASHGGSTRRPASRLSRSSLVCVELSCNWATSNVPWSCSRRQRPWRRPWMIRINWGASPPMARYCFLMGEHDVARAASEHAPCGSLQTTRTLPSK